MPTESQIGHFSEVKNPYTKNRLIAHNAIFISHNATFCDVSLIFKFLNKTLKHKICYIFFWNLKFYDY